MKCSCGKDIESIFATIYSQGWFDDKGDLIGGICVHGIKFGKTFEEYIKEIQKEKLNIN